MARMLIKNLKHYSLVAFSWNDSFYSINFEPDEVKDCTGIQINTKDNFELFVRTYVRTNILCLIPVYDGSGPSPSLENGYFDFAYVDYGWII